MEYAFGAKTFQKEPLMSLAELFCDVDDHNPDLKLTQRLQGKLSDYWG